MRRENYKRLGDYIAPYLEKNVGLKVTLSQGINNNKYFQTPRQVAVDSENDQIVRTGQFAYNKATTRNGEKISIAYREGPDCTVSSAYQVFYIKDEEELNPHYLLMWFKRPEFDRYARFKSFGSAHEFFTWEEMCNVYLPIPDIDEQRKIVTEYQAVEQRIENNNRLIKALEDTAQAIYHHTFVENIDPENLPEGWSWGTIADIADISSGKTILDKLDVPTDEYIVPVAGATGIIGYSSEANYKEKLMTTGRVGTLGVVNRYYEPIWAADNVIVVISKYFEFTYQVLNHLDYNELTKLGVQSLITKTGLENYKIVLPSESAILAFLSKVDSLADQIRIVSREKELLVKLKNLLLSKLS